MAANNTACHQYRLEALSAVRHNNPIPHPNNSRLDITLAIWNSLLEHRTLTCEDGMNISLTVGSGKSYSAMKMSDGEKAILFMIAQVIQAPRDGFIVIDEPETHLHRSISKKLWDTLESERKDCVFVYLTHDIDFATSRVDAKKIWVKSFTPPEKWEIEEIDESSIPEALVLELLGSRQNILFCEGKKGSLDEKIYRTLFPQLTITPVESCFNVINYVRAFNKIKNASTHAFGLIDRDHQPDNRIETLAEDNIYTLPIAEVENILMDECFLQKLAVNISAPELAVTNIKQEVFNALQSEIEKQAANFVSSKIDFYFKDSHLEKGNSIDQVKENLDIFNSEIKANEWYESRKREIDDVIARRDYTKAISIYNNKGLKKFANQHLSITNFFDRAIKFLEKDMESQKLIKKYFPPELSPIHSNNKLPPNVIS